MFEIALAFKFVDILQLRIIFSNSSIANSAQHLEMNVCADYCGEQLDDSFVYKT